MSEAIPAALQFDYAEPVAGAATLACATCSTPLAGIYHKANDKTICSTCRVAIEAEAKRGGLAKSLLFGAGAALAGCVIYFLVLKVTGYQLSLITILVGYMVGRAVSEGSGGRGGKRYQALAVFLTYLSITATYVPMLMEQLAKENPEATGVVALIVSEVLALAVPFLIITEDPLTLVIIGIGVYQAWQMNKRRTLDVSGPYQVAPSVG